MEKFRFPLNQKTKPINFSEKQNVLNAKSLHTISTVSVLNLLRDWGSRFSTEKCWYVLKMTVISKNINWFDVP